MGRLPDTDACCTPVWTGGWAGGLPDTDAVLLFGQAGGQVVYLIQMLYSWLDRWVEKSLPNMLSVSLKLKLDAFPLMPS